MHPLLVFNAMLSSRPANPVVAALTAGIHICSGSMGFAAELGTKFGTYFTQNGGVLELYKKDATSLQGRFLKLGQSTDNPITVIGENSRDGTLKLNFYKGGQVLDTINYSRTATREPSAFGSQVYTSWDAQETALNEDLSKYGLNSFKSLIIGTADAPYADLVTGLKTPQMKLDVNLGVYVRLQSRLNEYFAKIGITNSSTTDTTPNLGEYVALSSSRTNAAYLSAVAAGTKDLKPTAFHIQTLGADNVMVFAKPDDIVKLAALGPSADGPANVLPQFLVNGIVGVKIPNPNLIRTYLTEFQLTDDDSRRLSNIFKTVGAKVCDKEPAQDGVMLIFCDYHRGLFASDGEPIWYRTVISIAMAGSSGTDYTSFALSAKSAAAPNFKDTEYEKASKQWSQPKVSVAEAEAFVLQAFIKGVSREYPKTRR